MNSGGIARRLIDFAKVIVGKLPGGLAFVKYNGLQCCFGAISGSAAAAASAIGGFHASGYEKRKVMMNLFSAAVKHLHHRLPD